METRSRIVSFYKVEFTNLNKLKKLKLIQKSSKKNFKSLNILYKFEPRKY